MEFDLAQFVARLSNLEGEMKRKPALRCILDRCILDADLEHNLSALRLMGILPPESEPVAALKSEPAAVKPNRHGGSRPGAGRKKIRSNADRQRAYRRRVAALRKSSSQVANFIDVKEG